MNKTTACTVNPPNCVHHALVYRLALPSCSFFRNPLGSVAFLQKLVQKETQDPSPAGSRPGSAVGPDRAPYELDSEEEAAAAWEGSEEEGPSREPSGFFRAFKGHSHASKPGGRAHAGAAASPPPGAVGRGSSSSAAAGAGGQVPVAAGQVQVQVAPAVSSSDVRPSTPRGQATIAAAVSAAPELAGYAGAGAARLSAGGGEAGRGLL